MRGSLRKLKAEQAELKAVRPPESEQLKRFRQRMLATQREIHLLDEAKFEEQGEIATRITKQELLNIYPYVSEHMSEFSERQEPIRIPHQESKSEYIFYIVRDKQGEWELILDPKGKMAAFDDQGNKIRNKKAKAIGSGGNKRVQGSFRMDCFPIQPYVTYLIQGSKKIKEFNQESDLINLFLDPCVATLKDGGSYINKKGIETRVGFAPRAPSPFDLLSLVEQATRVRFSDIFMICYSAIKGLKALHDKGIIHRDLKIENLLLGENGHGIYVIVSDFGHAIKSKDAKDNWIAGSATCLAPECLTEDVLEYIKSKGLEDDIEVAETCLAELQERCPDFKPSDTPCKANDVWAVARTVHYILKDFLKKNAEQKPEEQITKEQLKILHALMEYIVPILSSNPDTRLSAETMFADLSEMKDIILKDQIDGFEEIEQQAAWLDGLSTPLAQQQTQPPLAMVRQQNIAPSSSSSLTSPSSPASPSRAHNPQGFLTRQQPAQKDRTITTTSLTSSPA